MSRHFRATLLTVTIGLLVACSPSRKDLQAELDAVNGQLTQSEQQNETLRGTIASLEGDIKDRDEKIAALEQEMGGMSTQLAELRDEQDRRKAELQTYKDLFARLQKLIDAGTIKVSFRKGRMIVELASAVLFDSGKIKLKEAGKAALGDLVEAFQSVADRDLMIAGHTDNIPIKTRRFKSNWDLSTARAVVVVNYMIEQGFPSQHLGAAGFGDQDPVSANDTEEGRALNRRIEIVLMPNLGELAGLEEMIGKQK